MPYIKKTVKAGRTMEVYKYHSYRYQSKSAARGRMFARTAEPQRKQNRKNAENRLRWKINANFKEGDYFITLTYKRELRPGTLKEAKAELGRFLRKVRREYRKHGKELRFISVSESGKNGGIHHHLIVNGDIEANEIVRLWGFGHPAVKFLDGSGDYSRLAGYLVKETAGTNEAIGYSCSRNLILPEITTEVITRADSWKEAPKAVKGYVLTGEPESGVTETGFPYQHYVMHEIE